MMAKWIATPFTILVRFWLIVLQLFEPYIYRLSDFIQTRNLGITVYKKNVVPLSDRFDSISQLDPSLV
jgi:hypothetical protein